MRIAAFRPSALGALLCASVAAAAGEASLDAPISPARQRALNYLLEQDCGSCHGMTRQGGLGPALLPQSLAGKSDALLIATLLDGRPGTAMPPWRGQLTASEAAWLVEQLRRGVVK